MIKKSLVLVTILALLVFLTPKSALAQLDYCLQGTDPCCQVLGSIQRPDDDSDDVYDECEETVNPAGLLITYMKLTSPNIIYGTLGQYGDSQSRTHTITWQGPAFVTRVDLLYSTDGGQTYTEIVAGMDNTGSYEWTLPEINADYVIIRVNGMGADGWNYGSDLSDAYFSIKNVA